MTIYKGRTIEAWEQGKAQGADAPTAPTEKKVQDPTLQAMRDLEARGVKFTQGTKKAAQAYLTLRGKVQPTAEATYKEAAASLQQRRSTLEADHVVAGVELARKGEGYEALRESIELGAIQALDAEVQRLDYLSTTAKRAAQTARLEFYREASTDEKAPNSTQELWAQRVAYFDHLPHDPRLSEVQALEIEAQAIALELADFEGFRAGQLGTAEHAKQVRDAILNAARLDVADRPSEHPTFESVTQALASKRKEAAKQADPAEQRKARKAAQRAEMKDLEKFYMTDEQRKASGIQSEEEAADSEDATAEAVA